MRLSRRLALSARASSLPNMCMWLTRNRKTSREAIISRAAGTNTRDNQGQAWNNSGDHRWDIGLNLW